MRNTLGIILAAGRSSRLFPATLACTKQVVPVYDKPLIYYALTTLIAAGIRDIVIITNPDEQTVFKKLLDGAGQQFGINLHFAVQPKPRGIAQAFTVVADQIDGYDQFERVALILGDNLFHGVTLGNFLSNYTNCDGASIFAYHVNDPKSYGVVEISSDGEVLSLEEKPNNPKSSYAIPGLYFYDNSVVDLAKQIKPSKRNELEITDLNLNYLQSKKLAVNVLQRGTVWMDMGTADNLFAASSFVKTIQERQGLLVSSIEEIAYRKGWISHSKFLDIAAKYKNDYGRYLLKSVENF